MMWNQRVTLTIYVFVFCLQPVASTINTLAGALYQVFCPAPDEASREMREACFDYLSLGGMCTEGPIALLSGLNPRPMSLVAHFFAVAVYGVGRLVLPLPSPKRILLGARLLLVSLCCCFLMSINLVIVLVKVCVVKMGGASCFCRLRMG